MVLLLMSMLILILLLQLCSCEFYAYKSYIDLHPSDALCALRSVRMGGECRESGGQALHARPRQVVPSPAGPPWRAPSAPINTPLATDGDGAMTEAPSQRLPIGQRGPGPRSSDRVSRLRQVPRRERAAAASLTRRPGLLEAGDKMKQRDQHKQKPREGRGKKRYKCL